LPVGPKSQLLGRGADWPKTSDSMVTGTVPDGWRTRPGFYHGRNCRRAGCAQAVGDVCPAAERQDLQGDHTAVAADSVANINPSPLCRAILVVSWPRSLSPKGSPKDSSCDCPRACGASADGPPGARRACRARRGGPTCGSSAGGWCRGFTRPTFRCHWKGPSSRIARRRSTGSSPFVAVIGGPG
jgi:hypothetical protein